MKNNIIISILTAIIVYFYTTESTALKVFATVLTIMALFYLFLKETILYNHYKYKLSNFKEAISEPCVNVNKASWKILALVPNIDKITAKHIVYNRRHFGNYKNFDDFFRINEISEDKREKIKMYIIL